MSTAQSYENHVYRPRLFGVGFLAWVGAVVAFALGLFGYATGQWGTAFVLVALACALSMGRAYIVALQDRIIKLEMRIRGQAILSPAQQALLAKLSNKHVTALRFASNEELPTLLEKAVAEQFTPDQIKRAIRTWVPDHDRT